MKQFSIAALILSLGALSIASAGANPYWYDLVERPSWIKKAPKIKGTTLEQRKIYAANLWLKEYLQGLNVRVGKAWKKPPKDAAFAAIMCSMSDNGGVTNLQLPPTSESQTSDSAAIAAVMNTMPVPFFPEGAPRCVSLVIEFDPKQKLPRARVSGIEIR